MSTFKLRVISAEGRFFDGECESLVFPTLDGKTGILADHCNMLGAVTQGIAEFTTPDGTRHCAAVDEGFVKVEDNDVLLLVGIAEDAEVRSQPRPPRGAAPQGRRASAPQHTRVQGGSGHRREDRQHPPRRRQGRTDTVTYQHQNAGTTNVIPAFFMLACASPSCYNHCVIESLLRRRL